MRFFKSLMFIIFFLSLLVSFEPRVDGFEMEKGERLTYSVRYLYVIPLGDAQIQIKDAVDSEGRRVFLIMCEAKTARWISFLFKAEAFASTYVDTVKLHPYKFEQVLKIAGKPDDIRRAAYDRVNNIMEAEGKGRRKVPSDVRDPISAIYYLRTQELKEGAEIKQFVNNNQTNYIFDSKVIGKKKIGKFNCWVLDATSRRENKTMYHNMDAVIYISDDNRRLPVLIQAATNLGLVTLRLKK